MPTSPENGSFLDRHAVTLPLGIIGIVLASVSIAAWMAEDSSASVMTTQLMGQRDPSTLRQEENTDWDTRLYLDMPNFRVPHQQRLCGLKPLNGVPVTNEHMLAVQNAEPFTDECEMALIDWWVSKTEKTATKR